MSLVIPSAQVKPSAIALRLLGLLVNIVTTVRRIKAFHGIRKRETFGVSIVTNLFDLCTFLGEECGDWASNHLVVRTIR